LEETQAANFAGEYPLIQFSHGSLTWHGVPRLLVAREVNRQIERALPRGKACVCPSRWSGCLPGRARVRSPTGIEPE
jgi:hypothetical protein